MTGLWDDAIDGDPGEGPDELAAISSVWNTKWKHHCTGCGGWGGWTFFQRHAPELPEERLFDPCEALPANTCHRCGQDGLTGDGEGPCSRCGWNYDDGDILRR